MAKNPLRAVACLYTRFSRGNLGGVVGVATLFDVSQVRLSSPYLEASVARCGAAGRSKLGARGVAVEDVLHWLSATPPAGKLSPFPDSSRFALDAGPEERREQAPAHTGVLSTTRRGWLHRYRGPCLLHPCIRGWVILGGNCETFVQGTPSTTP